MSDRRDRTESPRRQLVSGPGQISGCGLVSVHSLVSANGQVGGCRLVSAGSLVSAGGSVGGVDGVGGISLGGRIEFTGLAVTRTREPSTGGQAPGGSRNGLQLDTGRPGRGGGRTGRDAVADTVGWRGGVAVDPQIHGLAAVTLL
jgi:hypothetical protein